MLSLRGIGAATLASLAPRSLLVIGAICVAVSASQPVAANPRDVTFHRNPRAALSSDSYNLVVVLHRQGGGISGQCTMTWSDPDDACTIAAVPDTSNALVEVYHKTNPFGAQSSVIGKISFWISIFENAPVDVWIPTGSVNFTTNANGSASDVAIAILPQANVEMGETLSDRPNSGSSYFGQTIGNCGATQLRADGGTGCSISMLAGCYSPVFAKPRTGTGPKTKIWVNGATSAGGGDNVLCIKDGAEVPYVIEVQ